MPKVKCAMCPTVKEVRLADIRRGWGKCCSKSCAAKLREMRPPTKAQRRQREKYANQRRDDYLDDGSRPIVGAMWEEYK